MGDAIVVGMLVLGVFLMIQWIHRMQWQVRSGDRDAEVSARNSSKRDVRCSEMLAWLNQHELESDEEDEKS